jgi:hypothetical protein
MSELIEGMGSGSEIDADRARRMLKRTTDLEKRNLQTKQYTTTQMVEKIRGLIEEEAECY